MMAEENGAKAIICLTVSGGTDEMLEKARVLAIQQGYISKGDTVVYTAGIPLIESPHTNMIKIQKV